MGSDDPAPDDATNCPHCNRPVPPEANGCPNCESTNELGPDRSNVADESAPDRSNSADEPDANPPGSGDESALRAIAVASGLGIAGGIALLLASVIAAVAIFVGFALVTGDAPSNPALLLLSTVVGQYVGFVGLGLLYLRKREFDLGAMRDYLGVRLPTLRELGIVVAGYLAIVVLIVVWGVILDALIATEPAENEGAQSIGEAEHSMILPLAIAFMFLVVAPCEEFLYRGIVQNRLRERLSAAPAIFVASLVFAAVHVAALAGEPLAVLVTIGILFVPATVLGVVYEYTGNLVVPTLLHGLHNSVIVVLILAGPA